MIDLKDLKYTLILFAAFSVMIVAIAVVGFFAITPLQVDIARLKESAATIVSRKETNERDYFIDRREEKIEKDLNERLDNFRSDLNALIAEINRILDTAEPNRRSEALAPQRQKIKPIE